MAALLPDALVADLMTGGARTTGLSGPALDLVWSDTRAR
jgi:hypothetical protein